MSDTAPSLLVATDASVGDHARAGIAGTAWIAADGSYGVDTFHTRVPLVAELAAIKYAVAAFPPDQALILLSDCQIAVESLGGVVATGRITTPAGITGSRDIARLLRQIAGELRRRPVEVRWVRGHDGHPLNEAADRLAVQARRCAQGGTELPSIRALTDRIAAELDRTVSGRLAS